MERVAADDRLWSIKDLAEYLGVTRDAVYSWRHRGLGPPAVKAGGSVRFRKTDVDRWLEENGPPAADESAPEDQ